VRRKRGKARETEPDDGMPCIGVGVVVCLFVCLFIYHRFFFFLVCLLVLVGLAFSLFLYLDFLLLVFSFV
jgi:hypothetical protein